MKQAGNALFLILIAVALFAALSYAITQSGRGGGSVDREQDTINAALLVQYGASIQQAIQKMQLLSGCTDIQISFWNDSDGNGVEDASDNYYNGNAPPNKSCHVFDPSGGGIESQNFSNLGSYPLYSGENAVEDIGACPDNSSDACKELMFMLIGISESLCRTINIEFTDDPTVAFDEIASNNSAANKFNGAYGSGATAYLDGAQHEGIATGCVIDNGGPTFYQVLIER